MSRAPAQFSSTLANARFASCNYSIAANGFLPKADAPAVEPRQQTGLREVAEETGYQCRLLPVTMATRLMPNSEIGHTLDIPRTYAEITEPVALTVRVLGEQDVKVVWWYFAAVEENALADEGRVGEGRGGLMSGCLGVGRWWRGLRFGMIGRLCGWRLSWLRRSMSEEGTVFHLS